MTQLDNLWPAEVYLAFINSVGCCGNEHAVGGWMHILVQQVASYDIHNIVCYLTDGTDGFVRIYV